MNAPCQRCENRKIGCHSSCEEYIEWKSDTTAMNEKIAKERKLDWQINTRTRESILENIKKGRIKR